MMLNFQYPLRQDVIETSPILKLVGRQKELNFSPRTDISYSIDSMDLGKKTVDIYLSGSISKTPSDKWWAIQDLNL